MKKFVVLFILVMTGCATTRQSSIQEDELMLTRKYVGNFVDYRQHIPEKFGEPKLIWIKTTMDSVYGKISAYGQKCEFSEGERLFVRRVYFSPGGAFGYWNYQIEADDSRISYRLSDFQHDRKVFVQEWFGLK
jgi:hypothetical protein